MVHSVAFGLFLIVGAMISLRGQEHLDRTKRMKIVALGLACVIVGFAVMVHGLVRGMS